MFHRVVALQCRIHVLRASGLIAVGEVVQVAPGSGNSESCMRQRPRGRRVRQPAVGRRWGPVWGGAGTEVEAGRTEGYVVRMLQCFVREQARQRSSTFCRAPKCRARRNANSGAFVAAAAFMPS